jgi:hypothetical protein
MQGAAAAVILFLRWLVAIRNERLKTITRCLKSTHSHSDTMGNSLGIVCLLESLG